MLMLIEKLKFTGTILVLVLTAMTTVGAAEEEIPEPAGGQCYAVIVGGLPGTEVHARRYKDWMGRFHVYLSEKMKVPAGNITVLSGSRDFMKPFVTGESTHEAIMKALKETSKKLKEEDQFVLILFGHGVLTEKPPTLVLRGQDLNAADLARELNEMTARNQVVLNLSASSGSFLPLLARKGRVNISATSLMEGNEPILAEFFLRGLESGRADGGNNPGDGTITVLEIYNWAVDQTSQWIMRAKKYNGEEGWTINGRESVEIFEKLYSGADGAPGVRKLSSQSKRNVEDERVRLKPEGGFADETWSGRRMLSEHALLEDCGEETAVGALGVTSYEPVTAGKSGEPGHLAGQTVIGIPKLLNEETK